MDPLDPDRGTLATLPAAIQISKVLVEFRHLFSLS
jgi:hypothetical protein